MPLESAIYISQLDIENPAHTDGLAQADAHLRLIKGVLQATLPNATGPITGTPAQLNQAAAGNANAGVLEVVNNGTVASGKLLLDPVPGAGGVVVANGATTGNPGSFNVVTYDASGANPVTSFQSDHAGNLTAQASLGAPSIRQAGVPLVPSGVIMMWAGSVASIPAGWHLCDGTNGTPDLRGFFVCGAGGALTPGQAGGVATQTASTNSAGLHSHSGGTGFAGGHTHPAGTDTQGSHSHTGADQGYALQVGDLPPHSHPQQVGQGSGGSSGNAWSVTGGASSVTGVGFNTQNTGGGAPHSHGISADGSHQHNVTVSAVPDHAHSIGNDGLHSHTATFSVVPPYVALCYIQKS